MSIHTAHNHPPPKPPPIKFIRNVLPPKKLSYPISSHKSQSTTQISPPQSSSTIPQTHSLLIYLIFDDGIRNTLLFNYQENARVNQLMKFIKGRSLMENVYFKSGNVFIDYFLGLGNRLVAELGLNRLELRVVRICGIDVSADIGLRDIEMLKCVGSGGFSKVILARVYGMMMAIKVINKEFIFKNAKQEIIQNQKQILQQCSTHPFITKLYLSFQTPKYIILGMQYCIGGQLFNLLRKIKKMKEKQAKFYFIQTLLAIQHLHQKGILYRDLKPENIIIDADGHVRLADFGLSKRIGRGVTYSFCGSAQYMSPEMLLKKGHSYQVDYYCIGALLYELVTGLPPFYSSNQPQLFSNILNHQLTFPSHATISQQLKQFLKKMLKKNPQDRFQTIQQIYADPWVSDNFDRNKYLQKNVIPPFSTPLFSFNFDQSQFGFKEDVVMREIAEEAEMTGFSVSFPGFYYESEEIIEIRNKCQRKTNFTKKFMLSRQIRQKSNKKSTSFHNSSAHISPNPSSQLIPQISPSVSPQKKSQNQPILLQKVQQQSNNPLIFHREQNLMNVRSSDNIRGLGYPAKKRYQQSYTTNIYTAKPGFLPSSNLAKRSRLGNALHSSSQKKIFSHFDSTPQHPQNWLKSQSHSHSHSSSLQLSKYFKPTTITTTNTTTTPTPGTSSNNNSLSQQNIKNYFMDNGRANSKLKRATRGEKIVFYYGGRRDRDL